MTARREELNRRNLLNLCEALSKYVQEGGSLTIETIHGDSQEDNQIVLTVPDWTAFRAALEPGTAIGES